MGGRRRCRDRPQQGSLIHVELSAAAAQQCQASAPGLARRIPRGDEGIHGWTDRIRAEGRHKAGDKLTDDAGKIITAQGGRASVTDGPYAESKEVVGGYYIVTASDYEDACQLAASCPHLKFGGRIEVRQIEKM